MSIQSPKSIIRTTVQALLDEKKIEDSACVYLIADPDMGVLYVGQTTRNIKTRIVEHFSKSDRPIGYFLKVNEYRTEQIRLDILIPPDDGNQGKWLYDTEEVLIKLFRPMFNNDHLGE